MDHSAEVRRCLTELDVAGMKRLHPVVWPHLPPMADDKILMAMHLARLEMKNLHPLLRAYSERWLAEHREGRIACAVGVSVKSSHREKGQCIAEAMTDQVYQSIKAGIDIDKEAPVVRDRMQRARMKERGGQSFVGWHGKKDSL